MEHGVVAQISGTTLWRWLSQDALRPWRHRYWIFPRDPAFAVKAGRILDLYQRRWQDKPLGPRDYVLCADEKTSIQARRRKHPSLSPAPGRPIYVEHEYARTGAYAYIAAWMSTAPNCSAAANARPALLLSTDWWRKSCARSRTDPPTACS